MIKVLGIGQVRDSKHLGYMVRVDGLKYLGDVSKETHAIPELVSIVPNSGYDEPCDHITDRPVVIPQEDRLVLSLIQVPDRTRDANIKAHINPASIKCDACKPHHDSWTNVISAYVQDEQGDTEVIFLMVNGSRPQVGMTISVDVITFTHSQDAGHRIRRNYMAP